MTVITGYFVVLAAASKDGTPWWTVLLTGLLAALLASGISGLIAWHVARNRNRHEREENHRERQVDAAATFAEAVGRALPDVRDAARHPNTEKRQSLTQEIDAAHALEHRVELLFGPESGATAAARKAIGLRTAGLEATAAKLEHAWSAESMVLALDIDDREALLRAMEDWCPWGRPIASDSQRYDWSTIEERGLGVDLNAIAR